MLRSIYTWTYLSACIGKYPLGQLAAAALLGHGVDAPHLTGAHLPFNVSLFSGQLGSSQNSAFLPTFGHYCIISLTFLIIYERKVFNYLNYMFVCAHWHTHITRTCGQRSEFSFQEVRSLTLQVPGVVQGFSCGSNDLYLPSCLASSLADFL